MASDFSRAIDRDGDLDVVRVTDPDDNEIDDLIWLENQSAQMPQAGDVNRDRQFDQRDIIQVLRSAKYLTGEPATFEEGDWNCDGAFDESDVVAALQTGNYLKGPYAARLVDAPLAALRSIIDH